MSKTILVVASLAVGLVLFLAVNILANVSLRTLRLDLTDEKLFTLAEGSKRIARDIDEPIRLRLYFSEDVAKDLGEIKKYAARVRELLEEYEHASDGKLKLEVLDPEPYSEVEEDAMQAGLPALPLPNGVDKLVLGLVGTNSTNDKELIEYFDYRQERFLEYEISRLIYALAHPDQKMVGVMAGLPLEGGTFNPMLGRPAEPRWQILDELERLFDTTTVSLNATEIPENVDLLLIVHPKNLSEDTLYAIDQFVLGGGRAVVLVDPYCGADNSGVDPGNPMSRFGAAKGSDLKPLFEAWGLELVPDRIAADRANALQVPQQTRGTIEYQTHVAYVQFGDDAFDKEDAVTSQLELLLVPTPGILRPLPEATTEFRPLIQTSDEAMDLDVGSVQFQTPPSELLARYVPGHERLTVAARISGPARSAFPDGPPGEVDDEDADEEEAEPVDGEGEGEPPEKETEEQEQEQEEPSNHLAGSDAINVIVIADADLLVDHLWIQEIRLGNLLLGKQKRSDNGDLVLNAVDNLTGGDDLISIRARGRYTRPFDRVEKIRLDAEERYLAGKRELERKLNVTEQEIAELMSATGGERGQVIFTPETEAAIERGRQEIVATNRKLREVNHNLRKDIERLGMRLQWLNILALPVLITIGAIGLGFYRVRRRKW
ncbi:MAG: Gldg family protein [Planctomycetota bacterium]|nr:Gldg family protein [Planctomycetota bacterium]